MMFKIKKSLPKLIWKGLEFRFGKMMLERYKFQVIDFRIGGAVDFKKLDEVRFTSLEYKAPGVVFICAKIIKPWKGYRWRINTNDLCGHVVNRGERISF